MPHPRNGPRRSGFEITYVILRALSEGSGTHKTEIGQCAALNGKQISKYLSCLQAKQVLEERDGRYYLTVRGATLVELMEGIFRCLGMDPISLVGELPTPVTREALGVGMGGRQERQPVSGPPAGGVGARHALPPREGRATSEVPLG